MPQRTLKLAAGAALEFRSRSWSQCYNFVKLIKNGKKLSQLWLTKSFLYTKIINTLFLCRCFCWQVAKIYNVSEQFFIFLYIFKQFFKIFIYFFNFFFNFYIFLYIFYIFKFLLYIILYIPILKVSFIYGIERETQKLYIVCRRIYWAPAKSDIWGQSYNYPALLKVTAQQVLYIA
jgi:hypothetical protein